MSAEPTTVRPTLPPAKTVQAEIEHTQRTGRECVAGAGVRATAVLSEVRGSDGESTCREELIALAHKYQLPMATIDELIEYRRRELCRVSRHGEARMPLPAGDFRAVGFTDGYGREHIAFVRGDLAALTPPLVRLHVECLLSDVLGSRACDCRARLDTALRRLSDTDSGVLIYLRAGKNALGDTLRAQGTLRSPGLAHRVSNADADTASDILDALGIGEFRQLADDSEHRLRPEHARVLEQVRLTEATGPAGRMGRAS